MLELGLQAYISNKEMGLYSGYANVSYESPLRLNLKETMFNQEDSTLSLRDPTFSLETVTFI